MDDMAADQQRPARDRAATEARLLEAGRVLFAKQGYAETSLEAVAGEAGVNKSLIVRYFGSKSGLLAAITAGTLDERSLEDLPYPPQATLGEELLEYLRYRFRTDQTEFDSIRLFFGRLLVDPDLKEQMQQVLEGPDQNFSDRIDALVEAGAVDAEALDKELLFRTVCVFSAAVNFTAHHLLGIPEAVCDAMFEIFARSLGTEHNGRGQQ